MNIISRRYLLVLVSLIPLATSCSSVSRKQLAPVAPAVTDGGKSEGKAVKGNGEDLDEYGVTAVSDPAEPVNRVTFWINHQLYTVILHPISKGYEIIFPKPVRQGLDNAFDNARFPIRVVNDTLQGNFKRAGQETGKFVVNTVVGVGGLGRPSDHIPALSDVPPADTGQTFAKWGIGNGPYVVLPLLGPSTLRDTVGLAGDYVLNPLTWVSIVWGGYAWIVAIPSTNTVRSLPGQLGAYDAATKDALDRYLSVRSAYIQHRAEAISK